MSFVLFIYLSDESIKIFLFRICLKQEQTWTCTHANTNNGWKSSFSRVIFFVRNIRYKEEICDLLQGGVIYLRYI